MTIAPRPASISSTVFSVGWLGGRLLSFYCSLLHRRPCRRLDRRDVVNLWLSDDPSFRSDRVRPGSTFRVGWPKMARADAAANALLDDGPLMCAVRLLQERIRLLQERRCVLAVAFGCCGGLRPKFPTEGTLPLWSCPDGYCRDFGCKPTTSCLLSCGRQRQMAAIFGGSLAGALRRARSDRTEHLSAVYLPD